MERQLSGLRCNDGEKIMEIEKLTKKVEMYQEDALMCYMVTQERNQLEKDLETKESLLQETNCKLEAKKAKAKELAQSNRLAI